MTPNSFRNYIHVCLILHENVLKLNVFRSKMNLISIYNQVLILLLRFSENFAMSLSDNASIWIISKRWYLSDKRKDATWCLIDDQTTEQFVNLCVTDRRYIS